MRIKTCHQDVVLLLEVVDDRAKVLVLRSVGVVLEVRFGEKVFELAKSLRYKHISPLSMCRRRRQRTASLRALKARCAFRFCSFRFSVFLRGARVDVRALVPEAGGCARSILSPVFGDITSWGGEGVREPASSSPVTSVDGSPRSGMVHRRRCSAESGE